NWTKPEMEILALCRSLGISCRTTAKIIATKLPLQCRRKTIKKHHISTSKGAEKTAELADSDAEDDAESDHESIEDISLLRPLQLEDDAEALDDNDDQDDDIKWSTGHGIASYEPQLLMPTADSAVVSLQVERLMSESGHVDWALVSQLTEFPVKYCLEMNTYNTGKTAWTYDSKTFSMEQATALQSFITQFYPAPTRIDFLAVSNFFWVCLPNCIDMYELLCGRFDWTPADINLASRLAAQGMRASDIARQLSPTMGARRVVRALQEARVREPEINIPADADDRSVAAIRAIVAELTDAADDAAADVPRILERARAACPSLDSTTSDLCTLAVLSTMPPFASRRSQFAARPQRAEASPVEPVRSGSARIACRWSRQETELLVQYARSTKNTKNWKYFAKLLGTKTPSQCTNKYRAMRKLRKLTI
ncbi:hypothetical protein IWW50_006394, partial [Coemansia erecta]